MMKHILLIEDNSEVRENTAEILELAGYRVSTAANGKEGVEAALATPPDLVICDIMMPVLDGYGVLHLLSKNESTSAIPFVFLTAKAERADMRKGMEMGADDYITKPFDDIELLNAVESRLKRSDRLRGEIVPTKEGITELLQNIKGIEDIASVSQRQQIKQIHKRDIIYSEGDSPAGLYLLTKGKVKVYKSHELGKDLITRMLHEGDFFGFLALLEGGMHAETAEALEDSEVVIFPKEDFFTLLDHSPQVMQQIIRLLSGNIADEQERLLLLAYSSVRKRTAEALLRLRTRYHDGSDKPFSMAIAREDLANMVGTATESLIRTLSDFRDEGLVGVQGSTITLLDLHKLERMKN
jgi:CRP/FNR family transcriptional regulator, polysaccharide utilization system transcription regulator